MPSVRERHQACTAKGLAAVAPLDEVQVAMFYRKARHTKHSRSQSRKHKQVATRVDDPGLQAIIK
eukprot:1159768-Pelagomonas_calceolata.AAC.4